MRCQINQSEKQRQPLAGCDQSGKQNQAEKMGKGEGGQRFKNQNDFRSKHGHCIGGISPEYKSWAAMRVRCLNPRQKNYQRYGAVGITICARWDKFENFLEDMGLKPTPKHSIERKDGKLGYSKENCVWADRKSQNNNTSRNHFITFNGRTMTLAQWAEEIGVNYSTLRGRFNHYKMTPERALVPGKVKRETRS